MSTMHTKDGDDAAVAATTLEALAQQQGAASI